MGGRKYRESQKAKGLCAYCPRPALPGTTACAWHKIKKKKLDRESYQLNKADAIARTQARRVELRASDCCISCGRKLNPEFDSPVRCNRCLIVNQWGNYATIYADHAR